MIDERVLDQIIPVPDIEEKKDEILDELSEAGFAINNGRAGGILITIIMIILKCHIELKTLARMILKSMFIDTAEDEWMELKAADFSKFRKLEAKTEGIVTLTRNEDGEPVRIAKGTIFKTPLDNNGEELKYITTELIIMPKGALTVNVPVIAEAAGSRYNVAQNQITKCLVNLEGIDSITNAQNWITKEGTDIEEIESLRSRTKSSWSELATLPIKEKYKNKCEEVEGVFLAEIDDQHPRGQGTVDIYITSAAGAASSSLINDVSQAIETIRGPYDNVKVMSTETVVQDVTVEIDLPSTESTIGIEEAAKAVIKELLVIKSGKSLNTLTHTDIIYNIKKSIPAAKAIRVTVPKADITLSKGKILVVGTINVAVRQV